MVGNPRDFESIGSRLGFRLLVANHDQIHLVWRGGRFPAFLCLGVAVFLLLLSIPVFQAIRIHGLDSAVGSLWYFPVMNVVLLGVVVYLLSMKRVILVDRATDRITLTKRNLWSRRRLTVDFDEVEAIRLGNDQVYSGFAVAGSTAGAKSFPALSLRLILPDSQSVLLERGAGRMTRELATRLGEFMGKPVRSEIES